MAQLTSEEIARYRADGWVRPRFRLPEAQVAHMRVSRQIGGGRLVI